MEQKHRLLIYFVASAGLLFGWAWLNQALQPPAKNPPANQEVVAGNEKPKPQPAGDEEPKPQPAGEEPQAAAPAENPQAAAQEKTLIDAEDKIAEAEDRESEQQPDPKLQLQKFPEQILQLGSDESDSQYRISVWVNSRGATIQEVQLNDPRYCEIENPKEPLKVIGDIGGQDPAKFFKDHQQQDKLVLRVHSIFRKHCYQCHATKQPEGGFRINTRAGILAGGDTGAAIIPGDPEDSLLVKAIRWEDPNFHMPFKGKQLPAEDISDVVRWIEQGAPPLTPVTMQVTVPQIEGQFEELEESLNSVHWELISPIDDLSQAVFRITSPDGLLEFRKTYTLHKALKDDVEQLANAYTIDFNFSVKNIGDEPRSVNYVLQGPIGVPLESVETTRKYQDVKFAYLDKESKKFYSDSLSAKEIAEGETSIWDQPILKYIGVDVQYFTAFVQPAQEQTVEDSYFASYTQLVVQEDVAHPERSDVSVSLTSRDLDLKPGASVTHSYHVYAGPKREKLLAVRGAESIMDLGWFGAIASYMLVLLTFFHSIIPNYGVAIIILTVLVRLCMFPLSRKQALGAAKMQEIKPEIDALKKKYGNDREKMGRAQMELFRKHKYNPFSGCLVLFIQMPIFFGLYRALGSSVDLRMAPFLWIDNLAAPDALFHLGFNLPFLGSDFNLLPIITIVLFIVQQKLFMPPPTDEQSAMQAKVMQYMMVFMGFMFYNVPAGLCVYFISSSLWGIAERKLLPKVQKKTEQADDSGGGSPPGSSPSSNGSGPKAAPKVGAAKRKTRPRR